MKTLSPMSVVLVSVSTAGILLCGCHRNQQQASANSATQADQPSIDLATANLAPVADTNAQASPNGGGYPTSAVYPPPSYPPQEYDGEYSDQGDDTADESYYGIEPADTAPEPPPPLPEYDQPPCPGDGYIWTPGYWDYASTGYYWVPGVWVQAPYVGALWTPGYWAYAHGRYAFFNGYWGPHIGFYGGINYGFGYTGVGYQGGYWNDGRFNYNRFVNNVNVNVVHNVYNRTIVENRTTTINNRRVSYNGGSGGIQVRPEPAELAALREPHAAPMQTQVQVQRSASGNRAQFAAENHGRPEQAADNRPVAAAANVRPAASRSIHNLPMTARPPMIARNHAAPANRPAENNSQANRPPPAPQQASRPAQNYAPANRSEARPEQNYPQPNRPQTDNRPQAQAQPARREQYQPAPNPNVAHTAPNRPEPQPRQEMQPNRQPAPQPRPQMQPSRPPAPEPNHQAQIRPAPEQNRPAPPQNRPAPQENRPAPRASHPAPAHNPPPQGQKDEHRPQ